MRVLSNLLWPQTPYGADKRPYGHRTQLLTGAAMQWVDAGEAAVPASVAAVFVPVKRTRSVHVTSQTLHFGYWLAVSERDSDALDLLRGLDNIVVQGRRHSAGIAWHGFADDLHVTQVLTSERLPGFEALGKMWGDRARRERGTAPVVDTAEDTGTLYGLPIQAAGAHGIVLGANLVIAQGPTLVQTTYEQITADEGGAEVLIQQLAAGILGQALSVALVGGHALGKITWEKPFEVEHAVELEAWHVLPLLYGTNAQRGHGTHSVSAMHP